MKKVKVVSLFSGVGGLDYGFIKAGCEVVYAIDNNPSACLTYKENFGIDIVESDIKDISVNDIPYCDIIVAGSPNNGFSMENQISNFIDNPSNHLVKKFVSIVKSKKPSVFIYENVPQILTVGGGKFADEIINNLNDYSIQIQFVNAVDYGVAQNRKSVIMIGSKIGEINFPKMSSKQKTVREAFSGLSTSNVPNQFDVNKHRKDTVKRMSHVPAGGNIKDIPESIRPKGNHSDRYKRLEMDKPSITIANPRKAVIIHPTLNRILTVRECARIQSFPDDFEFYGELLDKQQIIANAFPPLLSVKIANKVMERIEQITI